MGHAVLFVLLAALVPATGWAQGALSLREAVALAQRQGHQARVAENTRDAARYRYRVFSASQLPQISLSGTLPLYNRSIIPVLQPDGSTLFRPQQQNQSSLSVNLTQRLPYTGGELFISSALSRLQVIGERDTRNWSSTPFQVGIRQNLLRTNTASWDARERELTLDIADRQYVEAREDIAIATAGAFFDYFAAKVALDNALANSGVNDTLFTLNQGRFEVGRIAESDLLQSELALLRSRAALDGARLDHDRTLAALRLQLRLPVGAQLSVTAPTELPVFVADTQLAVAQALRNRSQARDLELQGVQAARRVSEARFNTGFGATVEASVGFNQTGSEMQAVYQDLREAQQVRVGVQMPLLQWGGRSAQIDAARVDQQRAATSAQLARELTAQEAHFAALQLAQSARQVAIAAKGDTVAAKRFEVARNRYLIGTTGIDDLLRAQQEKDQALVSYVQSLRAYWTAYYRLRRVTLYDFEAGEQIGRQ